MDILINYCTFAVQTTFLQQVFFVLLDKIILWSKVMAIRFNIDRYNIVRESYLLYLRGENIDQKMLPLYETYKVYLKNDQEIKKQSRHLS